ncbi:MAG: TAT-variant-translocated molybdopterin oxidoreductase, partial [Candidatus Eiseniibacteriota bacterium]
MTDAPLPNSPQNTELTPRLDLRALRARLAGRNGRDYWRSLDELAGSQEFGELLEREFPRHATHWDSTLDRRRFLQLMGASLALAGLTSCRQQPLERIVPYVKQPEEIVPGKPLYFASATTQDGFANGVLVESHMGRPTKIEGNPLHPASLGATDARTQATVLTLYDPDRSRVLLERGQIRTWDNLRAALDRAMRAQRGLRGAGLRILTGAVTSPTLAAQIDELERLLPEARWHQYTPGHADGALAGTRLAFRGQVHAVHHDLRRAEVIVTLDADLLGSGPGHVRYAREFAAWRRVRTGGGHEEQGRHAAHGGSNGHASAGNGLASGSNGHASGGNGHASGGNGLASGGNGLASGGNGLASAGNDALVA